MVKKNEDLTKYVLCECGEYIYKSNMAGHRNRREHKKNMKNINAVDYELKEGDIYDEIYEEHIKKNVINEEQKERLKNELLGIIINYGKLMS